MDDDMHALSERVEDWAANAPLPFARRQVWVGERASERSGKAPRAQGVCWEQACKCSLAKDWLGDITVAVARALHHIMHVSTVEPASKCWIWPEQSLSHCALPLTSSCCAVRFVR